MKSRGICLTVLMRGCKLNSLTPRMVAQQPLFLIHNVINNVSAMSSGGLRDSMFQTTHSLQAGQVA